MTLEKHAHAGWSGEEEELLFAGAERAKAAGEPLKSVFDAVAAETGRRPNSIRNHYYARVRESESCALRHTPAFTPFTEAESIDLLETVLTAQASGESVRACTMRLGSGDQSAMLRYQNKYRALVRSRPDLVERVLASLGERGIRAADPYAKKPQAVKPHRLGRDVSEVVSRLEQVEGLDTEALFAALGTLALQALRGSESEPSRTEAMLRAKLRCLEQRCDALTAAIRSLVSVNTDFLHRTSVVKTNDLGGYLGALEESLLPCERLLAD